MAISNISNANIIENACQRSDNHKQLIYDVKTCANKIARDPTASDTRKTDANIV